jgi:hypothetical protein
MALETLKEVKQIGGFDVTRGGSNFSSNRPVFIFDDLNQICFQIQNGPVKENGVNGCQVNTIIEAAKLIIEGLNQKFPCRENAMVITKLDEALMWLQKRKLDREKRNVEGHNKA